MSKKLLSFTLSALLSAPSFFGAMLFALGFPVEAQQSKKVPRIAILSINRPGPLETIDGLRRGLRDLGYIEGQNIIIEYRFAERRYDRLPRLAAELVSLNPDVDMTCVVKCRESGLRFPCACLQSIGRDGASNDDG